MKLKENLKKIFYRRLRAKQELLLVCMRREGLFVLLQNKSEQVWVEQVSLPTFNDDAEKFLTAAEAALRMLLLQRDVEENAACVFLLDEAFFYTEEMRLPLLPEQELKQALVWEAKQCVPWEQDSYTYICLELGRSEDQIQLKLHALQLVLSEGIRRMAGSLYLRLYAVSADLSVQEAVRTWYDGADLADLLSRSRVWQKIFVFAQRYCYRGAALCVLLSILAYGGALAGRYLASENVWEAQRTLAQHSKWEQRYKESSALESELRRLEDISRQLQAQRILWSAELEDICRLIPQGCWLSTVEPVKNKSRLLQIRGGAWNLQVVQDFTEALQRSGKYQQVQLVRSGSSGNSSVYEYVLQLQLKTQTAEKQAQVSESMQVQGEAEK